MTVTRVWTKEELDKVWPLPDGWVWARDMFDEDEGRVWIAELIDSIDAVWVSEGVVGFTGDGPPVEVTLAVCMVSLGFDSPAWIADALERRAADHASSPENLDATKGLVLAGRSAEARVAAGIVRRGRVLS